MSRHRRRKGLKSGRSELRVDARGADKHEEPEQTSGCHERRGKHHRRHERTRDSREISNLSERSKRNDTIEFLHIRIGHEFCLRRLFEHATTVRQSSRELTRPQPAKACSKQNSPQNLSELHLIRHQLPSLASRKIDRNRDCSPGVCPNTARGRLMPCRGRTQDPPFSRLSRSFTLPNRLQMKFSDRSLGKVTIFKQDESEQHHGCDVGQSIQETVPKIILGNNSARCHRR